MSNDKTDAAGMARSAATIAARETGHLLSAIAIFVVSVIIVVVCHGTGTTPWLGLGPAVYGLARGWSKPGEPVLGFPPTRAPKVFLTIAVLMLPIVLAIQFAPGQPDNATKSKATTGTDVSTMSREQAIAEVERRIAAKHGPDDPSPLDLVTEKFGAEMQTDAELGALRDRAWKAEHLANAGVRATANVDRIHYYRDSLLNDAKKAPTTVAEINAQLTNFEEAGRLVSEIVEGMSSLSKTERAQLQAFRSFVGSQQAERFPVLRRIYAKGLMPRPGRTTSGCE